MKNLKSKIIEFLIWSQKYTKIDMLYLVKGSFWFGSGQVFSSAATFTLAIAFANFIEQETYGTYKYILSITGILTVLSLRGMDSAVLQSVTRNFEGVLIPALKTKIRWGFLSALASVCIALYYYINGNNTISISFLIVSGFLPFIDSFGIYSSFLNGKKLFHVTVIYKTIIQLVSTTLMIAGLILTKNLFVIILIYFASLTFSNLLFFIITLKKYPPNAKYDANIIPYGKHSSVINIFDALITSIDGLLIFHYLGPINLAIYSFALAPISQIRGLLSNIATIALPKLAVRSSLETNTVLKKRIFLLFILGASFSFIYTIIAPYIYSIFFPKYIDSVFSSQLFSLSIILALPQTLFGAAIGAKLTCIPKKMLYLSNIPGIVFIISLFALIGTLGINGVILSRLISHISGFIINCIMWRKIREVEKTTPVV